MTPQSSACLPNIPQSLNPDSIPIGSTPNSLTVGQQKNILMFVGQNKTSPTISVIDCLSYKSQSNITTNGNVNDYAIDESKNMLYVADANDISIYNLNDRNLSNSKQIIHVPYPSALSINPSKNRLYVH